MATPVWPRPLHPLRLPPSMSMMSTHLFDVPLGLLSNPNILLLMYSLSVLWKHPNHLRPFITARLHQALEFFLSLPNYSSSLLSVLDFMPSLFSLFLRTRLTVLIPQPTTLTVGGRERKKQKNVDPESWRVSSTPLTFTHFTDRKSIFQRTDESVTAFFWPVGVC